MPSRFIKITLLFLSISSFSHAKIHDAFMCYTDVDTVVLFGILKDHPTLRINYFRLDKNPTTIDLKVHEYSRESSIIKATGLLQNKDIIQIYSEQGMGHAKIDLTPFSGTEDISFDNEEIRCHFGKFEE